MDSHSGLRMSSLSVLGFLDATVPPSATVVGDAHNKNSVDLLYDDEYDDGNSILWIYCY